MERHNEDCGSLIRTHIKTHLEGHYILEPGDSLHGKSGYPFIFNIDGQGIVWKVIGVKEEIARHDENGKRIIEGGSRYDFFLNGRPVPVKKGDAK